MVTFSSAPDDFFLGAILFSDRVTLATRCDFELPWRLAQIYSEVSIDPWQNLFSPLKVVIQVSVTYTAEKEDLDPAKRERENFCVSCCRAIC